MSEFFPELTDELRALVSDAEAKAEDARRGIYQKYKVDRTDGSSEPGGKHEHCRYFVLDLNHDKHAIPALVAYCQSCRGEFPALAYDLEKLIESLGNEGVGEDADAPTFSCTLKQIMDADLWLEYCEESGLSEWAVNEGLPSSTEVELPLSSKVAQEMFRQATFH